MANYQPAPEGKDPLLWEIAKKRASFKTHAVTYVIMNGFFWAVWYFSSNYYERGDSHNWSHFPWPVWPMIGWGIGLAFHYAGAYIFPKSNSVENEYEKLKSQQKK